MAATSSIAGIDVDAGVAVGDRGGARVLGLAHAISVSIHETKPNFRPNVCQKSMCERSDGSRIWAGPALSARGMAGNGAAGPNHPGRISGARDERGLRRQEQLCRSRGSPASACALSGGSVRRRVRRQQDVHGRQLSGRGTGEECGRGQGEGPRRRTAGGLPLAPEAHRAGHRLQPHGSPQDRQRRRLHRRRRRALGAQLEHGVYRRPRLLLPGGSGARPSAPRRRAVHRRAGSQVNSHSGDARDERGFRRRAAGFGVRRVSRRERTLERGVEAGSISTIRSRRSRSSRCCRRCRPASSRRCSTEGQAR